MSKAKKASPPPCPAESMPFWAIDPTRISRPIVLSGMDRDSAMALSRQIDDAHRHAVSGEVDAYSRKNASSIRATKLPPEALTLLWEQAAMVNVDAMAAGTEEEKRALVLQAMEAGFHAAVVRYFEFLKDVPELQHIKAKESLRQEKSRNGKKAAKEQRAAEAQQMLDSGAEIADVAAHFGRSKGTIYKWLSQVAG